MKALPLLILFTFTASPAVVAQLPGAKAPPPPAKLTAKEVRGLPFCREFKEMIFKANSREIADELRVTMAAGVRISGKKRAEGGRFGGKPVGHVGKVALMPVGARAGKLIAKVPSSEDVTYYYAMLEKADGKLDTKFLELLPAKAYTWSLKTEDGGTTLVVLRGRGVMRGRGVSEGERSGENGT